jgi:capsular exopolysaccharide synthesis family protein
MHDPKKINAINNQGILSEYLKLIKANITPILFINIAILLVSVIFAITSKDIYQASTDLKISTPQESILTSPLISRDIGFGNDLLIANEIQTVINSYVIREEVTSAIIDSFNTGVPSDFNLIVNDEISTPSKRQLKDFEEIMGILEDNVSVEQIGNLDFISIIVESESPKEAALIANVYAEAYREFNLAMNRNQLTTIRKTLDEQRAEKLAQLVQAENNIKAYQLRGGVIQLDAQAKALINKLTDFESDRNTTKIQMSITKETLDNYKAEIKKRDPSLIDYLESKSTEPYLQQLQKQIAELESQRDMALINNPDARNHSAVIKQYDTKIDELKNKLRESIEKYQTRILSSSPEEIKDLTQKIFAEQVKYQSMLASYNQLGEVLSTYEEKFNNLPQRTLDLARLERERSVFEKLYLALEEKYQEALINEQSIPGNVFIMNSAYPPLDPAKPNRPLIIVFGAVIGFGFGFGFIYMKDYLNRKVKSPEDIKEQDTKFLTWIPRLKKDTETPELIVYKDSDIIGLESFRALRTRIQFSKIGMKSKTFLITSSAPGEGKTVISMNLASSFAKDGKKTIILDCDLRKPRIHSILKENLIPGLSDFLFGKITEENIIRATKLSNLYYIPAGTIPPNPSEIINSSKMVSLLQKLRNDYDVVILDSAPIMAVADSEILSNFVDASILVTSANSTEIEWLNESSSLLKNDQSYFLGVVLNNFEYKRGYTSSYKYVGYYSSSKEEESKKKDKRKS